MTEHLGSHELRLVVIEDESMIAMEMEDILEDLGHRVLGVGGSVPAAARLIDKFELEIDAVLLDANLGGASTVSIADTLRDRHIPFIVTSGYEPHELRHLGFEAPRLAKPYGKDEVRRALSSLSRRAGEPDSRDDA